MKLPALLVSDLHLTANPRDAYRWELFKWMRVKVFKRYGVERLHILGDLTDAKDNHSSTLVNRIVDELATTAEMVEVDVLQGNHDYLKKDEAFFRFLDLIPGCRFIDQIRRDADLLYLPHTRTPNEDWSAIPWNDSAYVMMHQTVTGSVASNGSQMEGELEASILPQYKHRPKIYSGDIHVPQVIGDVEYVGSPYHVHFGDRFTPRAVLLDKNGQACDLHFPTISKFVVNVSEKVDELVEAGLESGDQVKVRVDLPAALFCDWPVIRQRVEDICSDLQVDLRGIEMIGKRVRRTQLISSVSGKASALLPPSVSVRKFADREGLDDVTVAAGLELTA